MALGRYGLTILLVSAAILLMNAVHAQDDDKDDSSAQRPNIVMVVADDLGFSDVKYNNRKVPTPQIHKYANSGIKLLSHYTLPTCSPSRSALLTGIYPFRMGTQYRPFAFGDMQPMPVNYTTLPQELKNLGYYTSLVGKWHLGECADKGLPRSRGFDEFYGFLTGSVDYDNKTLAYDFQIRDFFDNETPINPQGYVESLLRKKSVKFLRDAAAAKQPFFLMHSTPLPHDKLQVPSSYIPANILNDQSISDERKQYLGMLSALDNTVSDIVRSLHDTNLIRNTLFIFLSDNGGYTDPVRFPSIHQYEPQDYTERFGPAGCNYPLRGGKGTLWQGGVLTPSFVYSPNLLKERIGVEENGLFHITDWMPTLLKMAKGSTEYLRSCRLDGKSQKSLIEHGQPQRDFILLQMTDMWYGPPPASLTSSIAAIWRVDGVDYKYTSGMMANLRPDDFAYGLAVSTSSWPTCSDITAPAIQVDPSKICGEKENDVCLFNLNDDRSETHNLLTSDLQRFDVIKDKIVNRIQRYIPQIVYPVNPFFLTPPAMVGDVLDPGYCNANVPQPVVTSCPAVTT